MNCEYRTPENIMKRVANQSKSIKMTFISAIITGVFAHLFMLTNKLPNADDVGAMNAYGQGARIGRWFLEILGEAVDRFFGNYSMPLFNGIALIVFLAMSSCIVVSIFEIKDLACCIFIGALFCCFPSVISTMQFMFTAPYYGIGVLLTVLAAKIIIKGRGIDVIWGIAILSFSIGIYQAYFPLCASILVAKLIQDIDKEHILKRSLRYAGCFLAGVAFYLLLSRLYNLIFDIDMVSYKGANAFGSFSFKTIIVNIPSTYAAFMSLMTTGYMGLTEYRILRMLFAFVCFIGVIILLGKTIKLFKAGNYFAVIWLIILMICYPVSVFGIYLSGVEEGSLYAIVMYPVIMLYILPVILISDINKRYDFNDHIKKWIEVLNYFFCIIMICVLILYIRFANEYYLWMKIDYEQTSSYLTTLVTEIKQCEGYNEESDVVIIGYCIDDKAFTGTDNFMDITLGGSYEEGNVGMLRSYNYRAFMQNYCGLSQINRELEDEVEKWDEVKQMSVYPADGSIQNIRGVIVVKVMEE